MEYSFLFNYSRILKQNDKLYFYSNTKNQYLNLNISEHLLSYYQNKCSLSFEDVFTLSPILKLELDYLCRLGLFVFMGQDEHGHTLHSLRPFSILKKCNTRNIQKIVLYKEDVIEVSYTQLKQKFIFSPFLNVEDIINKCKTFEMFLGLQPFKDLPLPLELALEYTESSTLFNPEAGVREYKPNDFIQVLPHTINNTSDIDEVFSARKSIRKTPLTYKLNEHKLKTLIKNVFDKGLYPCAGGFYEIFPVVEIIDVSGISSGFFDFRDNQFKFLEKRELNKDEACKAKIHLVSKIEPLVEKYNGISLKLTYQNSGVLLSYLYLECARLEIACCAYGVETSFKDLKSHYRYEDGFFHVSEFLLT